MVRETIWQHLAVATLVVGLLLPISSLRGFQLVEARFYDIYSTIGPPRPDEPGALVVAIDEPSFTEIGQRWPWSRELHARLIDKLRQAGAKVVGFDIIFAEPSTESADAALANALGPDVVLAADWSRPASIKACRSRGLRPSTCFSMPEPRMA